MKKYIQCNEDFVQPDNGPEIDSGDIWYKFTWETEDGERISNITAFPDFHEAYLYATRRVTTQYPGKRCVKIVSISEHDVRW